MIHAPLADLILHRRRRASVSEREYASRAQTKSHWHSSFRSYCLQPSHAPQSASSAPLTPLSPGPPANWTEFWSRPSVAESLALAMKAPLPSGASGSFLAPHLSFLGYSHAPLRVVVTDGVKKRVSMLCARFCSAVVGNWVLWGNSGLIEIMVSFCFCRCY